MVCLDTTFLIDVLRGRALVEQLEKQLPLQKNMITVASPSVMELVKGLHLAATALRVTKRELSRITEIISSLEVLSLDKDSAVLAGEIEAFLVNAGATIDLEDIMIAAIAIKNDESLVTRNAKHFKRIPRLKVISY